MNIIGPRISSRMIQNFEALPRGAAVRLKVGLRGREGGAPAGDGFRLAGLGLFEIPVGIWATTFPTLVFEGSVAGKASALRGAFWPASSNVGLGARPVGLWAIIWPKVVLSLDAGGGG